MRSRIVTSDWNQKIRQRQYSRKSAGEQKGTLVITDKRLISLNSAGRTAVKLFNWRHYSRGDTDANADPSRDSTSRI